MRRLGMKGLGIKCVKANRAAQSRSSIQPSFRTPDRITLSTILQKANHAPIILIGSRNCVMNAGKGVPRDRGTGVSSSFCEVDVHRREVARPTEATKRL